MAWERYERFALWSTWAPQILAVRLDVPSGAEAGAGGSGDVGVGSGGAGRDVGVGSGGAGRDVGVGSGGAGPDVGAGAQRLAPGLTGTVLGPVGVRVRFRVDEVDAAARRWSWTVRPAGPLRALTLDRVRLRLVHGVVARPGGGSITTLDVHGPLPVVASYAPLALVALRRLVRA